MANPMQPKPKEPWPSFAPVLAPKRPAVREDWGQAPLLRHRRWQDTKSLSAGVTISTPGGNPDTAGMTARHRSRSWSTDLPPSMVPPSTLVPHAPNARSAAGGAEPCATHPTARAPNATASSAGLGVRRTQGNAPSRRNRQQPIRPNHLGLVVLAQPRWPHGRHALLPPSARSPTGSLRTVRTRQDGLMIRQLSLRPTTSTFSRELRAE